MAANNTLHYEEIVKAQTRNTVLLAAVTKERGHVVTGGERDLFLAQLETDTTARLANDGTRVTHYDTFETN